MIKHKIYHFENRFGTKEGFPEESLNYCRSNIKDKNVAEAKHINTVCVWPSLIWG